MSPETPAGPVTGPQDEPQYLSEDTLIGSERDQLMAFLDDNRTEVLALLDGLTEEQARPRLVPSATSAARHREALRVRRAGLVPRRPGRPEPRRGRHPRGRRRQLGPRRRRHHRLGAGRLPRRVGRGRPASPPPYDLDDLAVHNRRGPLTLRWIYVHMVEELARHAGHGDILREQLLAAG